VLGGDGTLLNLLKSMYQHYSHVELPPIAAFNLGSLGYLCNF
jgi:NAD kinase